MTGLVPIDTNEQTTLEISQETVVIETDEKELETSQYALDPKPRKRSIDETCEPNELNEPDVIKRQKSVLKRDLDDTNEKVVSGDIEKPTILKEDQDEKLDIDEVQSDKKEDHDETMVINKDSSELKEVVSPVKAGSKNPVPDVLGEKKEVTPIETKEHTPNQTSVATDKSTEKEDKEIAKESSAQEQTAEITARTKGISMEEKVSTPKEKKHVFGASTPFGGRAFSAVGKKDVFGSASPFTPSKFSALNLNGNSKETPQESPAKSSFVFGSKTPFSGPAFKTSKPLFSPGVGSTTSIFDLKKPKDDEKNEEEEERETTPSKPSAPLEDRYVQVKQPLTEKQVVTGEESEESIFSVKAKLYALDITSPQPAWKERGIGTLHVNKKYEPDHTYKSRIVMRSNGVLKVILNLPLLPEFEVLKGMKSSLASEKFIRITAIEDDKPIQYALRVNNKGDAEKLYESIASIIPQK